MGVSGNGTGSENGRLFWVILVIVTCVMLLLVYLFFQTQNPGIARSAAANKGLKQETGPGKADRRPISRDSAEYRLATGNCSLAEEHLKYDRPVEAKEAALKVLASGLDEGDMLWGRAVSVLNKVNTLLVTSDLSGPEKAAYVVQKGDTLSKIASDNNTTVDLVLKSNGLNPSNPVLRPGKTIKIFKGNWKVEVSKKRFKLYLYNGENLFKVYNIGTGKRDKIPSGNYEIDVKKKEPAWLKDGKQIPFGSKENILGTRLMSLKPLAGANADIKGAGIHGTWSAVEIGRENDDGSIRLVNDDVNELYMLLPSHTTVTIGD